MLGSMRHWWFIGCWILAACGGRSPLTETEGNTCTPHQSVACVGAGGCAGGQACNDQGTGYLDCNCGDGGAVASNAPADAGSDATLLPPTFLMKCFCDGMLNTATLYPSLDGGTITILRNWTSGDINSCTYTGTLGSGCDTVAGTYVCGAPYSGSGKWSAYFTGEKSDAGCTLGSTWQEQEAFTGETPCSSTWTQVAGPPLSN
jgi:hypothetical protein